MKALKTYSDVWAVIAAFNEEKDIGLVLSEVKKYTPNIVVVDDGSKDKTCQIAKENNVYVLKHIVNLGKGAALKTGCDFAVKNKAKILILIDADGQHDPEEIPNFLKEIKENDIVFGYRKFSRAMPLIFKIGNTLINRMTRFLYDINLNDTQSGYRALTADAYKKIRWKSADYSVESEMIANAGKNHLRYKQIPIETVYSDKYKGSTLFDGIKIVCNMFLWRLRK